MPTTAIDPPTIDASDDASDELRFADAMPHVGLLRLRDGTFTPQDLADFRRMLHLTQETMATAMGISVDTLQNWEQGHRNPEGPARALIRVCARHPRILLRELARVAS